MSRIVRILHISDLHARSLTGKQGKRAIREAPSRWRVMGEAWERNLAVLQEDGRAFDIVVFTGDLADWGVTGDYEEGIKVLKRTCEDLKVPLSRLFLVPGNHDIDRSKAVKEWKVLRRRLSNPSTAVVNWIAGSRRPPRFKDIWLNAIVEREAAFWKAVTIDLGRADLEPARHPHGRLGYQAKVELEGLATPIWIAGLDTAWLAGDDSDTGALTLTEPQIELLTSEPGKGASLPGLRIALMHHRFADLADGEQAKSRLSDRVDLVLHGHQHVAAADLSKSPDRNLLVLAAGCLYEGDEGNRYKNSCQVIDLALNEQGRPERAAVRFRGWSSDNQFWGDDSLLYREARGGCLTLRKSSRGWDVEDGTPPVPPWRPSKSGMFVGRERELQAIEDAMAPKQAMREPIVAVQGMAGVGKSFLVEEFCARKSSRFEVICRWLLEPLNSSDATVGLLHIVQQAGIDRDRVHPSSIPALLAERKVLVIVENVDGEDAARVVASLLSDLPSTPAIVTGRYTALGTTPGSGWERVVVECLDEATSIQILQTELGAHSPAENELRKLAVELGGLPLALHLAAGHLRNGFTVASFLKRLRESNLALKPSDPADPLSKTRSQGLVSLSFAISKELFLAAAVDRGESWKAALSALGWSPIGGFGRSLGASIVGLEESEFEEFILTAMSLSLVSRVPRGTPADEAWSVHPLLAEFLRGDTQRLAVDSRIGFWACARGSIVNEEQNTRAKRWNELSRESAALQSWLRLADVRVAGATVSHCWPYAASHGPIRPWFEAAGRACESAVAYRSRIAWAWARLGKLLGEWRAVEQAVDILEQEGEDESDRARAIGLRADIHQAQGRLDEALRLREEEEIPLCQRLGDSRLIAEAMLPVVEILVTRGSVDRAFKVCRDELLPLADKLHDPQLRGAILIQMVEVLRLRGDLVEALRILQEEVLPLQIPGDFRSGAIVMGKIADIFRLQGKLDEALQVRRDEVDVYKKIGDEKEYALAKGKIATILEIRGQSEEALKIRCDIELPVYRKFGDAAFEASTWMRIADIILSRGDAEEALRIYREKAGVVFVRLGDVRSAAMVEVRVSDILRRRDQLDEALEILRRAVVVFADIGDNQSHASTTGKIAEVLLKKGDHAEAARLYSEEVIPAFERIGDPHGRAVAMGGLADVLEAQGKRDDALHIRLAEELPVHDRLRNAAGKALTLEKVALTFQAQGKLEEAHHIRFKSVLPVYERLGDLEGRARVMAEVSKVLKELDERLRTLREQTLPQAERSGDLQAQLGALDMIAGNYIARGDYDQALNVVRQEVQPITAQEGMMNLQMGIGVLLIKRGSSADLIEARAYFQRVSALAEAQKSEVPAAVVKWLASNAGR